MEKDEELEFATKEDLEVIKKNPELSKVHAAMLAGVNKKFSSWADEKKELQKSVETLQSQVAELDGGLLEWENWFTTNKPKLEKALAGGNQREEREERRGRDKMESDPRYDKLAGELGRLNQQWERRIQHMNRMLGLSMQLNDLYRENPKLDGNKVLDIALKKGYTNLMDAYRDDDAYGKEILSGKVEEALKPRLEEELAKHRTNVETGSGSVPSSFELPKEMPKSFSDAGKQFLEERAKEAAKPGTGS